MISRPVPDARERASSRPSTESWSVRAIAASPRDSARSTISVGDQVPSEWKECVWRSTVPVATALPA